MPERFRIQGMIVEVKIAQMLQLRERGRQITEAIMVAIKRD